MVTTVRLPDELHEDLKRQAEWKGMTLNAYLLSILWKVYKKGEGDDDTQGKEVKVC